jgi:hypothetical protein
MSKKKMTTPEEVLNSVVEGIKTGNLDSLMMLYETDACFASQPGHVFCIDDSRSVCRQEVVNFSLFVDTFVDKR